LRSSLISSFGLEPSRFRLTHSRRFVDFPLDRTNRTVDNLSFHWALKSLGSKIAGPNSKFIGSTQLRFVDFPLDRTNWTVNNRQPLLHSIAEEGKSLDFDIEQERKQGQNRIESPSMVWTETRTLDKNFTSSFGKESWRRHQNVHIW